MNILQLVQKTVQKFGYNLVDIHEIPGDIREKDFLSYYEKNKEFSMTSIIRMYAFYQGIKYILDDNIEEKSIKLLWNRIDYNGRLFVKTD